MLSSLHTFLTPLNNEDSTTSRKDKKIQTGTVIETSSSIDKPPRNILAVSTNIKLLRNVQEKWNKFSYPFKRSEFIGFYKLKSGKASDLIPFVQACIQEGIIPFVFASNEGSVKYLFDASQFLENPFNMTYVSREIGGDEKLTKKLFSVREPYLCCWSFIGIQSPYIDTKLLNKIEKENYNCLRLGVLKKEIAQAEPAIRFSDLVLFNINAIANAPLPGKYHPSPIGLSAEEACQLAYYGGRSERNPIFCLFGWPPATSNSNLSTLLGNLLWYFCYGLEYRPATYPPESSELTSYILEAPLPGSSLNFFKHKVENKWWLKYPKSLTGALKKHPFIPCDYEDYNSVVNGEALSISLLNVIQSYERFMSRQ